MKQLKIVLACLVMSVITTGVFAQEIADNTVKKNVKAIDDATTSLIKLEPKQFEYDIEKYKHLGLKQGVQYGFLAENVEQTFPELVQQKKVSYAFAKNSYRDAKLKTVDEESLIPVMVAAIKELHSQIQALQAEIATLKQQ